jgi:hypothetical protein
LFAAGFEPERSRIDNKQFTKLSSRAAYSAFIGDACSITHSIPEQIRKIINFVYPTAEEQQQQIAAFTKKKSDFANNAQTIGIWKRCYLDAGKTRVLVSDVGRELDDFYKVANSWLNEFETQHAQWQNQVTQERVEEEAAKREKTRLQALKTAEQLGKLVVNNAYGGGRNIGVNLTEHEYFENDATYKLKVELTWNSIECGESGTASVTGIITAVFDDNKSWQYGKNYGWNPLSQSGILDEWLTNRQNPAQKMMSGYMKALGGC